MYQKNDEINNETPISFLTVGQLISVMKRFEKVEPPLQKSTPEIFGLEVLCELSGYSKSTIYAKTCRNEIPHFKRGSKLLFRKDEIVNWLTASPVATAEAHCIAMDERLLNRKNK